MANLIFSYVMAIITIVAVTSVLVGSTYAIGLLILEAVEILKGDIDYG
jgi:hypothetical protein